MRVWLMLCASLVVSTAQAATCQCTTASGGYAPAQCPVGMADDATPGQPTSLWFQREDIASLMAMLGAFSGRTACLGAGVSGDVSVKYRDTPWTAITRDVARRYGYAVKIDSRHIYLRRDR